MVDVDGAFTSRGPTWCANSGRRMSTAWPATYGSRCGFRGVCGHLKTSQRGSAVAARMRNDARYDGPPCIHTMPAPTAAPTATETKHQQTKAMPTFLRTRGHLVVWNLDVHLERSSASFLRRDPRLKRTPELECAHHRGHAGHPWRQVRP